MTETINKPTSLCFFLPSLSTYEFVTSYHIGTLPPLWSLNLPFLLNSKTSNASGIDSRTFEEDQSWIFFKNEKWKGSCSVVSDSLGTPWTVAYQVSLSMAFSRQEYQSGLPFPSRRSSWPRDRTQVSCICRHMLYLWATREAQESSLVSLILNLKIIVYWAPILWKIFWEWGNNCEYDIVRTVCGFCIVIEDLSIYGSIYLS